MSVAVPAVLAAAREAAAGYERRLRALVALDGPSGDAEALRRVADAWAADCADAGLAVERVPVTGAGDAPLGDVVIARRPGAGGGLRIVLVGHLDTVHPAGTAAARPWRRDGPRALAPGISDDRGGLLAGLAAVELVDALEDVADAELVLVATPDEELGSPGSAALLARVVTGADAVLCLECARPDGALVSSRKGSAELVVALTGRAAHAGVDRDTGADAAVSAARLALALRELDDAAAQTTVTVGVIAAGSRANVVAAHAELRLDLRAATPEALAGVLRDALACVEAADGADGVTTSASVAELVQPWAGGPGTERLLAAARAVGDALGVAVTATTTGGSGDANLLAATGAPLLDGLGPVGGALHGHDEWLDLATAPERIALLAGLVTAVAAAPAGQPGLGAV